MIKISGTRQEIFDKVVKHARKQGKKSVRSDNENACMYRAEDGSKCFVGAIIPDSEYSEELENLSIDDIVAIGLLDFYDTEFLQDLQSIHDDCDIDQWGKQFSMLAEKYGLEYK